MADQILINKILKFLEENPGTKARYIASSLDWDKKEINNILYRELKDRCKQDSSYNWYLKENFNLDKSENSIDSEKKSDTLLTRLCSYYSICISEDSGAKVKVFARSKFELDYKELNELPLAGDFNSIFESSEVQKFLNESRRDKSKVVYFGYPVLLSKAYSKETKWEGYFLSPIFLFPAKVEEGGVNIDLSFPIINREVFERYTDAKGEELIRELLSLEEELGMSGEDMWPELDELAQRLKNIHPEWQWIEDINPYNLNKTKPINECDKEGILNRAVILQTQESINNYTQGLEYELSQLAKLSENDYADTALGQWLKREIRTSNEKKTDSLLEVFPMNLEQREAVKRSLLNNLTIITGPPGTGKSQVVANLLINAAWQGKRVLFTSKNNKAVDVVETRVNNIGTRPVILRLGGKETYQNNLVSYLSDLLTTTNDPQDEKDFEERKQEFENINADLLGIEDKINDFVSLRNKVDNLDIKLTKIQDSFPEDYFLAIKENKFLDINKNLKNLSVGLDYYLKSRETILEKIKFLFFKKSLYKKIGVLIDKISDVLLKFNLYPPIDEMTKINYQDWFLFNEKIKFYYQQIEIISQYFSSLNELQKSDSLESLTNKRLSLLTLLSEKSTSLWKLWIKVQSSKISPSDRLLLGQYKATVQMVSSPNPGKMVWRNYYQQSQQISHILPAWSVSSLSAKGRVPFNKDIFDLVVFDESSQCDIASALPLLYRAKRAVIIGDPKQLSHISPISKKQDEKLLEKYDLLNANSDWAFSYNSLFDLASSLADGGSMVNLRDHYRSHADIISFSNKFFYDNRLRLGTKYNNLKRPKDEKLGLRWIDVKGEAKKCLSGSGSENEEEARKVLEELNRLFKQEYKGTIGVVSPFRGQANLIRKLVFNEPKLADWLNSCDFLSETVHKFQGDERDIIIFSPVISKNMPNGSTLFLKKTGNLFNVAITRARGMLFVVGDYDAALNSDISYMREFAKHSSSLFAQEGASGVNVEELGPEYPLVSNPERVSDWEHIFYKELYKAGIKAIPQYQEGFYTLDFALFKGDRKLNIEIDGEHYHKDWTGELCYRDQMRNQRMFELGWDVVRFWVYEIKDDLEGSILKVKKWLEEVK